MITIAQAWMLSSYVSIIFHLFSGLSGSPEIFVLRSNRYIRCHPFFVLLCFTSTSNWNQRKSIRGTWLALFICTIDSNRSSGRRKRLQVGQPYQAMFCTFTPRNAICLNKYVFLIGRREYLAWLWHEPVYFLVGITWYKVHKSKHTQIHYFSRRGKFQVNLHCFLNNTAGQYRVI